MKKAFGWIFRILALAAFAVAVMTVFLVFGPEIGLIIASLLVGFLLWSLAGKMIG